MLGFRCSDGVVLAADTMLSQGKVPPSHPVCVCVLVCVRLSFTCTGVEPFTCTGVELH